MERDKVRADFLAMIEPFVRKENVSRIDDNTLLVDDLNVQSARLVDIILEMEDRFQIRIDDDEAGALTTVGSAVDLVVEKTRKAA